MSTPIRATRVRRARASSVCGLCPDIIRIGNQIGHVPGIGWAHTACIIAAQAEHPAHVPEEPRGGRPVPRPRV